MDKPIGSLCGRSVHPLCANHHPYADITDDGVIAIACDGCEFYGYMSLETYLALIDPDEEPGTDILKDSV